MDSFWDPKKNFEEWKKKHRFGRYTLLPLKRKIDAVTGFPREVKWFIQRGRRGWADIDHTDIFSYLDNIIPALIKSMMEHGIGYQEQFTEEDERLQDWGSDAYAERHKDDSKKWDEILNEIIAGFEAHKHYVDCYEESCPGYWKNYKDQDDAEGKRYDGRHHTEEHIKFKRGMELFAEWYDGLWC